MLYPARLPFKIKGEIDRFSEKKKKKQKQKQKTVKGVHYYQTSITRNIKGTAIRRIERGDNIGIKNQNGSK